MSRTWPLARAAHRHQRALRGNPAAMNLHAADRRPAPDPVALRPGRPGLRPATGIAVLSAEHPENDYRTCRCRAAVPLSVANCPRCHGSVNAWRRFPCRGELDAPRLGQPGPERLPMGGRDVE